MISSILNGLSIACTFVVANGLVYFLMNLGFGKLKMLNEYLFGVVQVKLVISFVATCLLINQFATFHRPW
jgi:hypothetical protein